MCHKKIPPAKNLHFTKLIPKLSQTGYFCRGTYPKKKKTFHQGMPTFRDKSLVEKTFEKTQTPQPF